MYNLIKNKSIILNKNILFKNKYKNFLFDIFFINKNIIFKINFWIKKKKKIKNKKIIIYINKNKINIFNILKKNIIYFKKIIFKFNLFSNGNIFSIIYYIKNKLKFKYDLEARGFFLKDQIYFMNKIGFNLYYNNNNIYNYLQSFNDY